VKREGQRGQRWGWGKKWPKPCMHIWIIKQLKKKIWDKKKDSSHRSLLKNRFWKKNKKNFCLKSLILNNNNKKKKEGRYTLIHCWWESKLVQPFWKTILIRLKKPNIDLPHDAAIPLLGIYPKECKSGYYSGTCTLMFISALFTIAKLWKQPWCPITDKWIQKMWYLYTVEFYSAIKRNEILSFASKWL
jgi:hypothetical protein